MGQTGMQSITSGSSEVSGASSSRGMPPGVRLEDFEVRNVLFTEKAILACPLPAKAWIELGRWNPLSLALLAPAWSYHISGSADHWWFVARSADRMYYYAAQFCVDHAGKNHVTGLTYLGMWAAIAFGLQYPEAKWWFARDWVPCKHIRKKRDLDRLLLGNPSASYPYSWIDNNCQHFAMNLYVSS
ncbi:unnamed protein product [Symbiodinium natans]|uniref:LRAT domain-containing protein n=1 Tax=Symbiodinium natans TaxID=878477 RepID=A0A812SAA5_9DINO|nr:unnamed protein product [Symbiodinium natans]